jgi:hypothetical protein
MCAIVTVIFVVRKSLGLLQIRVVTDLQDYNKSNYRSINTPSRDNIFLFLQVYLTKLSVARI